MENEVRKEREGRKRESREEEKRRERKSREREEGGLLILFTGVLLLPVVCSRGVQSCILFVSA